jgi:asparagine synthase (glutamine-hydrolysing)
LPPEPSLEALTAIMFDVLSLVARHGSAVLTGDGGDPVLLPTSVSDQIGRVPAASLATDVFRTLRLGMRPPLGIRSRVVEWLGESEEVPGWLGSDLLKVFDARARRQEIQHNRNFDRSARRTARNEVTDPWWTSAFESFDPGATGRPVELRYPFFDVRLASFVLRLPSFPWCLNKHVLRESTKGRLPEAVRVRSKTPFAGNPWGAAGQWSSQRALDLLASTSEMESFVDVRKFGAMVNGDSLLTNETFSAWAAISLAMWLRYDPLAGAPNWTV